MIQSSAEGSPIAGGATKPSERGRLLSILGVGFGLAVIIGNTIAAGILRAPGEVAAQLNNIWLFMGVWVAGGLYALLGAISVAELGATIPRSGGQYVFARHAIGDYAGFIVGWSDWISTCGTTAAVSITIGDYTGRLLPALAGVRVSIALTVVILFALLQWRGIRWGSGVQNVTSLLKTLAFTALVAACFAVGSRGEPSTATHQGAPSGIALFVAIIIALQAVVYTYDGWTGAIYFSEEVRDPGKNIPRALFGGVAAIIVIYLMVNAAILYILPLSAIAGEDLALGKAAQVVFGPRGDAVFRTITIISMLSGVNAYHLMASRVLFAMSRDGLFWRRAASVNAGGTPAVSLLLSAAVAVVFVLSGTFEQVTAVLAFFFVTNYTMSFVSLFVLRWREPERPRPHRAWGYPWTTGIALFGSVAFLVGAIRADPRNTRYALATLALSYPVYRAIKRLSGKQIVPA